MKCSTKLGLSELRRTLTLVELILVLLILVISTTVILQSTQQAVEQSRFDVSRRSLEQIRDSILGSETLLQPDGTPIIEGFVNDLGRPPKNLRELFDPTASLNPIAAVHFESRHHATVTEAALLCGWRGPYLRLPIGKNQLRDGYNQEFDVTTANAMIGTATIANVISSVEVKSDARSRPFNQELKLTLKPEDYLGTVTGTLRIDGVPPGATDNVKIHCYYPNGIDANFAITSKFTTVTGQSRFSLSGIPIGFRCVRAEQTVGSSSTKRSEVIFFYLLPRPRNAVDVGTLNLK